MKKMSVRITIYALLSLIANLTPFAAFGQTQQVGLIKVSFSEDFPTTTGYVDPAGNTWFIRFRSDRVTFDTLNEICRAHKSEVASKEELQTFLDTLQNYVSAKTNDPSIANPENDEVVASVFKTYGSYENFRWTRSLIGGGAEVWQYTSKGGLWDIINLNYDSKAKGIAMCMIPARGLTLPPAAQPVSATVEPEQPRVVSYVACDYRGDDEYRYRMPYYIWKNHQEFAWYCQPLLKFYTSKEECSSKCHD